MIQSEEIPSVPGFFKPLATYFTPVIKRTIFTDKFNLYQSHFGKLADKETLVNFHSQLLEIDISEELRLLKDGADLEITLPVLGVVDLLNPVQPVGAPFASIVGLNGFGSKSSKEKDSYPHADHLLVTDIVGNQYELLLNEKNEPELPQEGTGLFSAPSSFTFIFSEEQIHGGRGFSNLQAWGFQKNKLTLLPPVEMSEEFSFTLCVSRLNKKGQRVVEKVRSVQVQFTPCHNHWQPSYLIHRRPEQGVCVELALRGYYPLVPILAAITVQGGELQGTGWRQDPLQANRYTKRFGLKKETLSALAHHLYPLSAFMADLLHEISFLKNDRGYNHFLIWPEAVEIFYELFIQDIANGRVDPQFLFEALNRQTLKEINLNKLPATFHDSVVLEDLQTALLDGNMLFASTFLSSGENIRIIKEQLLIHTDEQRLPRITVELTHDTEFSQAILQGPDQAMDMDCGPIRKML